ncbi:zinc ribbon domain-containing protein [Fonticella tunisiensis]|uniref:Uncharacterized protein n=1 Tax=Fonticella tunisiensis TaxID=1096341 RepID=A0A4R7K9S8_9CLOT|nr:zinc ribbon domain-containing protein [Fonticella tunisiensis]TDT50930.1 hypothetical protein EDD71_12326 [Fonticella tunisiensis]
MGTCKKCGAEFGKNDQFCVVCGGQIIKDEGKKDFGNEMLQETAAASEPGIRRLKYKINIDKSRFENYGREIFTLFKDVFTKPVAASSKYAREPLKEASFISMLIMGILQGFLAVWISSRPFGRILKGFLPIFKTGRISPYGIIFLRSFIVFGIVLFALTLGLFISAQLLYNVRVKLLSLWNIVSISGILYVTMMLVLIMTYYAAPSVNIVFAMFITVIILVSIYQSIKEITGLSEDRAAFTAGAGFILMAAIIYLLSAII